MTFAKDDVIEALRLRYDHHSAQSVFELARERAGLADQDGYAPAQLRAWREALAAVGDRVGSVLARLDDLLARAPATASDNAPAKADAAKTEPVTAEPTKRATTRSAPELIEATIVLTGVEVGDGEQVLVCGEPSELGDWEPDRAKPMARSGTEWRTIVTVPAKTSLAFKFLRRDTDGTVTWEAGDNRTVAAAPRVEAVWR